MIFVMLAGFTPRLLATKVIKDSAIDNNGT